MNVDMEALFWTVMNLAAVATLWWLYFVGYRAYRRDKTRQALYRLRDELFDYWDAHGLDFDHRAYRTVRALLNGMIRSTNQLSITFVLLMIHGERRSSGNTAADEFAQALARSVECLPKTHRRQVLHTLKEAHRVVGEHLVRSALPTLIVDVATRIVRVGRSFFENLLYGAGRRRQWREMDAFMVRFGERDRVAT